MSVINAQTEEDIAQERKDNIERSKQLAKRMIWVTFQKEGIHKYPAALTDPALQDVSFLGHPHRHMFQFKVAIDVYHNDRDIEFILFKRWLESLFEEKTIHIDYKSVEMLADDLYNQIASKFPGRNVIINVSEDGENGCEIRYETSRVVPSIQD